MLSWNQTKHVHVTCSSINWLGEGESCALGHRWVFFSSVSSSRNTGTSVAALPVFQGCYWRSGEGKLGSNYNWSRCPNFSSYFKIWAHSPRTNTGSWILLVLRTENNLLGWSPDPISLDVALTEEGQAMSRSAVRSSGADLSPLDTGNLRGCCRSGEHIPGGMLPGLLGAAHVPKHILTW